MTMQVAYQSFIKLTGLIRLFYNSGSAEIANKCGKQEGIYIRALLRLFSLLAIQTLILKGKLLNAIFGKEVNLKIFKLIYLASLSTYHITA